MINYGARTTDKPLGPLLCLILYSTGKFFHGVMSFDGYGGGRGGINSAAVCRRRYYCSPVCPFLPISSTVYRLWEVMEMEFIPIQQILMDSKDRMQMKSQRRLRWLCPDVYFEWFLILTDFSLLYAEPETMQPSSSLCCCCYVILNLYNAF